MRSAVHATDIGYRYNGTSVLKNVSLTVSPGEFFVIAGPNGSGKTTLIKILAGLFRPPEGDVSIMEIPMQAYSKRAFAQMVAESLVIELQHSGAAELLQNFQGTITA